MKARFGSRRHIKSLFPTVLLTSAPDAGRARHFQAKKEAQGACALLPCHCIIYRLACCWGIVDITNLGSRKRKRQQDLLVDMGVSTSGTHSNNVKNVAHFPMGLACSTLLVTCGHYGRNRSHCLSSHQLA